MSKSYIDVFEQRSERRLISVSTHLLLSSLMKCFNPNRGNHCSRRLRTQGRYRHVRQKGPQDWTDPQKPSQLISFAPNLRHSTPLTPQTNWFSSSVTYYQLFNHVFLSKQLWPLFPVILSGVQQLISVLIRDILVFGRYLSFYLISRICPKLLLCLITKFRTNFMPFIQTFHQFLAQIIFFNQFFSLT